MLNHPVGLAQASEDLENAQDRARGLIDQTVDALPRIGIALAVLLVAWLIARLVRYLLERRWARSRTTSFADVMPKLVAWTIVALGLLAALTLAFPSVDPVDVLAGLGVISIAAGFAFQDIFSNLLSGLLLIMRQPFVAGDQITVDAHQGTVESITIRETSIKTFDGRRILIPNKDVYQNAICIQTAHPAVRTSVVVGCSYDDDLERAARTALDALGQTEGVLEDPGPEAYFTDFGDSSINLDLRYWSDPHQAEIRHTQHHVIVAVKAAFDEAGLDIPWPIRTLDTTDSFRQVISGGAVDESALNGSEVPR